MRKIKKTLVTLLIAVFAVTLGAGFATMQNKQTTKATAITYTAKDVAMMGRIAGWHGNGNFEIRFSLGEGDWDNTIADTNENGVVNNDDVHRVNTADGDLKGLLTSLDFFNKVKLGEKTLAEWGCAACYDNIYWINEGEPDFTIRIPLSMGKENMDDATDAGIRADMPITILEGALIPSHGFLQRTSNNVYRAGCEYVTSKHSDSSFPYGIYAIGKTEVEAIDYVTGWDDINGNAYLGVSLKGDDYLADGVQLERDGNYIDSVYTSNIYNTKVTVDGESGKVENYGLFNLGEAGKGFFAFVIREKVEDAEYITIPAGTTFPSHAMTYLPTINSNNKVYIFYQTQTDATFYKTSEGWRKVDKETFRAERLELISDSLAEISTEDYFASDVAALETAAQTAISAIEDADSISSIDSAYATFATVYNALQTKSDAILNAQIEINAYKEGLFRANEEAQRAQIVATAETAIESATSQSEVDSIVANAKQAIDALKTDAELIEEELAGVKANAKSDLDAYKSTTGLYRDDEAAQRQDIVDEAKTAITSATSEEDIATIVANAKTAIDALKTDAEYDAEESLAAAKTAGLAQVNEKKASLDLGEYSEENVATINTLYKDAKAAIEAATTEADVSAIVAAFESDIDAIPTVNAGSSDKKKSGCSGSVGGASGLMALLTLGAVVLVARKRK